MNIIEVNSLAKSFSVSRRRDGARGPAAFLRRERRDVSAVSGISFAVSKGEMIGYIGPNGAGKSTTIKMLTGILVPTSGQLRVAGMDPVRQRVALTRRLGVVFGQRTQLWWDLPLGDSFHLLRHIYRVPEARFRSTLEVLVDMLDLGPLLATPVRQLSLGQRMRGDLVAALLHGPDILYLDEPTIGLDVVAKARIREFLAQLNKEQGVTVLLTTHDMSDVERLCSRIMVIDHGRLIYDGGLDALRETFGRERTVVVDLDEPGPPLEVAGTTVVKTEGPRQWLRFARDRTTAAAVISAVVATGHLRDLTVEEPEIEDIIRRIYEGEGGLTKGDRTTR